MRLVNLVKFNIFWPSHRSWVLGGSRQAGFMSYETKPSWRPKPKRQDFPDDQNTIYIIFSQVSLSSVL